MAKTLNVIGYTGAVLNCIRMVLGYTVQLMLRIRQQYNISDLGVKPVCESNNKIRIFWLNLVSNYEEVLMHRLVQFLYIFMLSTAGHAVIICYCGQLRVVTRGQLVLYYYL